MPRGDEGSGHPEKVTPEQWQSLLPQTFPADAPSHGRDQALLLQTSTEQLGQMIPPWQVPLSWPWGPQPGTGRAGTSRGGRTMCPSAAPPVLGERRLLGHGGRWKAPEVGLLLCSWQMPFSYYFSVQEKEISTGKAAGTPRHIPWSCIFPPHAG